MPLIRYSPFSSCSMYQELHGTFRGKLNLLSHLLHGCLFPRSRTQMLVPATLPLLYYYTCPVVSSHGAVFDWIQNHDHHSSARKECQITGDECEIIYSNECLDQEQWMDLMGNSTIACVCFTNNHFSACIAHFQCHYIYSQTQHLNQAILQSKTLHTSK